MASALNAAVLLKRAPKLAWRQMAVALGIGLGGGGLFVSLAARLSPLAGAAGVAGLLVCLGMFLSPSFALMAVGASVPVERIGRLTEDSQTITISVGRIVGLMALAALMVHLLAGRKKLILNRGIYLYSAYSAMALLTILWANYPQDTTRDALRVVGNLLFYFYAINAIRSYSLAKAVLLVWLIASVGTALYAIYDYHLGKSLELSENQMGLVSERASSVVNDDSETPTLGEKVRRVFGTTSHPTIFGLNLTMTVPFLAFFIRIERRNSVKLLYLLASIAIFYGIFLSNTRAVMLLAAATIIAIVCKGFIRFTPVSVVSVVLLVACLIPLIPRDTYMRSLDPLLYTTEKSGSFRIRFKFWAKSFELIKDHWLLGIGVGDQTTIVNMVTDEWGGRITPQGVKATAHNEFIWTMVEVGLFGWLMHWSFIAWIIVAAIRAGRYYHRAAPNGEEYWLCSAIQIMLVGVVFFGVQQEVFHLPLKAWWLTAGIAAFLYASTKRTAFTSFNGVPA